MHRYLVICCLFTLWFALGHCNTLILQPNNDANYGNSYAWIIPPQNQQQPTFVEQPTQSDYSSDPQYQSPPTAQSGCGHPLFNRQYSQEQLRLPNEYLVAPNSDPYRPSSPTLQHPVNCNGVDCSQYPSNLAPVQAIADQQSAPSQPINWPSGHGGGIGLLFFVPQSASHIPVEHLIHQQLALHQARLRFDIPTINCRDSSSACTGGVAEAEPPTTATTFNGDHVENVNYASLPLVKNVNSSSNQLRVQSEQRSIGELLAQQQQQQHLSLF